MGEATYKLQVVLDLKTIAKIDAVAENNSIDRTNAFRMIVNYALRVMPYEVTGIKDGETAGYKHLAPEDRLEYAEQVIDKYIKEEGQPPSETFYKEIYEVFGVSYNGKKYGKEQDK
jgi:hypothetical protein